MWGSFENHGGACVAGRRWGVGWRRDWGKVGHEALGVEATEHGKAGMAEATMEEGMVCGEGHGSGRGGVEAIEATGRGNGEAGHFSTCGRDDRHVALVGRSPDAGSLALELLC